jgi:hypothetical protein
MLAEATPPLPPSTETTALVVLFWVPALIPETFTAKLQDAPAASVAPVKFTLAEAANAVIVPPPQLPVRPLGAASTSPAGIVSVKPIPLNEALLLGLDNIKVNDEVPFNATLAAPNTFAMVGGEMTGGGGVEGVLDDPPPQPKASQSPGVMTTHEEIEPSFAHTFPGAPFERP